MAGTCTTNSSHNFEKHFAGTFPKNGEEELVLFCFVFLIIFLFDQRVNTRQIQYCQPFY